jgi:hypothetical protein
MKNELLPIEKSDHWILPFENRMVSSCCIDTAFSIEMVSEGVVFGITIAGTIIFKIGRREYRLPLEGDPTLLGPALAMMFKTVKTAVAYKEGSLHIIFTDGSSLAVEPDPVVEAWEIHISGRYHMVCLPGGGLTTWLMDSTERDGTPNR